MNSGQTSYVRQLTSITDINTDRGWGTASTRFCKVSVIASPAGIVAQLDTEGSICGQRLGMKPQT
jgi:hypothetical protein